ncbi:odorant receptor 85c-like [Leptidea sinapis]|uniref:odorant receptor 85c-like n=1 Tax=Leptidea sinapis TaxID=189913 RepID=UPI0021C3F619|nr:odorant receptor 85c-like [Leptidea sinapis]
MERQRALAKEEIESSLRLSTFCMRRIGFSFDRSKSVKSNLWQTFLFTASILSICYHVLSEIIFIILSIAKSPNVEDIVPLFHTTGYGVLSIAKVFALWYKKTVFRRLLNELEVIWPVIPNHNAAKTIKEQSLNALYIVHSWYFAMNICGVWFYNLTPLGVYFYKKFVGINAPLGTIWSSWYPFDKEQSLAHAMVYCFEIFAGQTCVWIMVCTDLLFSGMASHLVLLLQILGRELESFAAIEKFETAHYQDLLSIIKLHQRLIRYCKDLGEAFSFVNLVNISLSSVNICCVVFTIVLLEPFVSMSNKLFLGSALIQVGMLCWYGESIIQANASIAIAAYNSKWYKVSPRCRRCILFVIRRAQKPNAFTAMNFTNISLVTYTSIMTRSYSYFALLYTIYNKN